MCSSRFVEPLREADSFHKNAFLMFNDIVASIREKALSALIIDRQGPEGQYVVWASDKSEQKHLYIFEFAGQFRFIQMLVKTNDERLRGQGTKFKAICAKLDIDPVIPLLLAYGIFRPRDVERFVGSGNYWLRRNLADHTLLLAVPDQIQLADPNSYAWDATVLVQSTEGTDSQYCESATVKIKLMTEIYNQNDIGALVNDLLAL